MVFLNSDNRFLISNLCHSLAQVFTFISSSTLPRSSFVWSLGFSKATQTGFQLVKLSFILSNKAAALEKSSMNIYYRFQFWRLTIGPWVTLRLHTKRIVFLLLFTAIFTLIWFEIIFSLTQKHRKQFCGDWIQQKSWWLSNFTSLSLTLHKRKLSSCIRQGFNKLDFRIYTISGYF